MKKSCNKSLKILWIIFLSLMLMLAFSWLRGGYVTVLGLTGFPLSMMAYWIVFFVATVFWLKRYAGVLPVWGVVAAVLAGTMSLDIVLRFILKGGFTSTLISLPDFIVRILAVFAGLWYYKISRRPGKIALVALTLLFALWGSYHGFGLWLNKLSFGTFTGTVSESVGEPLIFSRPDGTVVDLGESGKDYVFLEFWNSRCGYCFEEMPHCQQIAEEYAADARVAVYSVHCRRSDEESEGRGAELIAERGHSFPSLSIPNDSPLLRSLGVTCYPTAVLIDANGSIVFRGEIGKGKERLADLLGR